jgi:tetratricopeptide (TPR) repeat protein
LDSVAFEQPCPSDDLLGALLDQKLAQDAADAVTAHLDRCDTCRAVVVAAVRAAGTGPREPAALELSQTSSPPLPIGASFGRYRVRALIGAGAMGQVYEAYDGELDRAIALKILRPELASAAAPLAERLRRESRLMAKVVHPAVITVYDAGREGDAVFVAMDLVRGETLGAYVARTRPSWRDVLALFAEAGEGLAAAHAAGIVHRDFKPENVLVELDAECRAKRLVVTDFGIARSGPVDESRAGEPGALADVRLTATGATVGTPAYMAPEQLDGAAVDVRADVFAFAVSLWEALFGARPFPGATIAEIRAAMAEPLRAPKRGVPARIVAALQRGLAIDRTARWPAMRPLLDELAPRRRRDRVLALGAAVAIAAIAALVVTSRAAPTADDPCTLALAADARAYEPVHEAMVGAALASDAGAQGRALERLSSERSALELAHALTCRAAPAAATTCLDARRRELVGYVADVIADGPRWADYLKGTLVDPIRCLQAPPGLLEASVPDDPVLRRKVTALRYRVFAIEDARDRGDFAPALADGPKIVEDAKRVWPAMHAEALYALGASQALGGNSHAAEATLRDATAVAESAHADYVAANAWTQLGESVALDDGAIDRGLEYLTYARAALDRIGHPDELEVQYLYVEGTALVDAKRYTDAEPAFRRMLEIAESTQPKLLGSALFGLGFLYEDQGRYEDAIVQIKRAIAAATASDANAQLNYRNHLAGDLSQSGHDDDAIAVSREAIAIADRSLGSDNLDRPVAHANFAQILDDAGRHEEALTEAQIAADGVRAIVGDRHGRYGEVLQIEGQILDALHRYREAAAMLERACDIIAFRDGDGSTDVAECRLFQTNALRDLGDNRAALALLDKAVPVLVQGYGEPHPMVANAFLDRGHVYSALGRRAEAIADLEHAADAFTKLDADVGHLADADFALAKELWRRDPARAHDLVRTSLELFAKGGAIWKDQRDEANEWLATDGHPR